MTFDAFTDTSDLDRPAFGEGFLQDRQLSAVHIVNGRNRWYHEPDWCEAINAAALASRIYARVVTYGSSMGGYAALLFSKHLDAQVVLALSPQYSRDPRKVPFETRWAAHRREPWLPELSGPLPRDRAVIVIYDPMVAADRNHVDCIANEMEVARLTLPYAGHGTAAFLSEVGLLAPLVVSVAKDETDLVSIAQSARDRRKRSPHYLVALSEAAHGRGRRDLALRLASRATAVAPREEGPWHFLGRVYDRLGAFDKALAAHLRAAELAPHLPAVQFGLAVAQRRAGDLRGALQTLVQLAAQPLPGRTAGKVKRLVWSTRALLWLAPTGLLRLIHRMRSKAQRSAQTLPQPTGVTDAVEAEPHLAKPMRRKQ